MSSPAEDVMSLDRVPSRAQQLERMAASSESAPFDVLIVGGGASGAGCAVDAATRWAGTLVL